MDRAPPVLLLQADFTGTLAATRCLGARGVAVTLAGGSPLAPARWSRYARHLVEGPDLREPAAILEWLRAFGRKEERHVLYPTSDELAWLIALHRDELSAWFDLYSPSIDALENLLDKRALHRFAEAAGIPSPGTWCPQDEAEVVRLGPQLRYPLLLKPRTQVFSRTHGKGRRVESPGELPAALRVEREAAAYAKELLARIPDAGMPMLQAWAADASRAVYTVSGFSGRAGKLFCARASRKILQRPLDLGVGICFEDAALDPDLELRLQRLCVLAGYQGAFDIEFLEVGGRKMLIDFNPRFYNQMAFEVDRGLPAPWLVWLGATGREKTLEAAVWSARSYHYPHGAIYCDRVATMHQLFWQRLFGTASSAEARRWRVWFGAHKDVRTDPMGCTGDRGPQIAEALGELTGALRHPRAFLRKTALGRSN
jgi:predicted ATP-grasp superfamily ATP-dependent carboligase